MSGWNFIYALNECNRGASARSEIKGEIGEVKVKSIKNSPLGEFFYIVMSIIKCRGLFLSAFPRICSHRILLLEFHLL